MPNDLIRYDLLVQDALCGVVKKVLADAAREGLPGEHHFYITFRTHAPGVRLSNRMREQYPDEMTIILQHQFEDLSVTDHAFEVGLSFKGIPEMLQIPFDALTGFFDPSVQFGLKFELHPDPLEEGANDSGEPRLKAVEPSAKPLSGKNAAAGKTATGQDQTGKGAGGKTQPAIAPAAKPAGLLASPPAKPVTPGAGDNAGDGANETKVVSIDAFRKKT